MGDIVFLRAWTQVEVPEFFNPLTTSLLPRDQTWQGMKTVAELRREQNLPIPVNKDSLYKVSENIWASKVFPISISVFYPFIDVSFSYYVPAQPIARKPRKFNPLVIPKSLQAALPFASKPKVTPSRRQPLLQNRRAVVMEPHERRVNALVQHLRLIKNEKVVLLHESKLKSCNWPSTCFFKKILAFKLIWGKTQNFWLEETEGLGDDLIFLGSKTWSFRKFTRKLESITSIHPPAGCYCLLYVT